MKIQQKTLGGYKEYRLSGDEREPLELFLNRISAEYPYAGYGTFSSGTRWDEETGKWSARISHRLTCD
jgi:hypothetical protein